MLKNFSGLWIFPVLLFSALSADAGDIYKCKDSRGVTIYSQNPCPSTTQAIEAEIKVDSGNLSAAEAKAETEKRVGRTMQAVEIYQNQRAKSRNSKDKENYGELTALNRRAIEDLEEKIESRKIHGVTETEALQIKKFRKQICEIYESKEMPCLYD